MPTFRFDCKADYIQPYFDMDGNFNHPCSVCGELAAFGFGVSLRHGKLGTWYCALHRPDSREKLRSLDAAAAAVLPAMPSGNANGEPDKTP